MKKIGGRIAYLRAILKLKQYEFGKILGISKGNVSSFENHKYEPSFRIIVQILEHINISPKWLILGKGNIHEEESRIDLSEQPFSDVDSFKNIEITRIFKRFKDKQSAGEINNNLLELESLNPSMLQEVQGFIKFKIGQFDRRKGERRQQDNPDAIPGDRERRSGRDRRKLGT